MATFKVFPIDPQVLRSPHMQEHSIEPAVEHLREWIRHKTYFRSYRVYSPTLEGLPPEALLVLDERGRYRFRRATRWYDVTKELEGPIKRVTDLPLN